LIAFNNHHTVCFHNGNRQKIRNKPMMNDDDSYSATDDVEEMYANREASSSDDDRPKQVLIRTTTKAQDAASTAANSTDNEEDVDNEIPSFVGEPVAKDFDGDTFFGSITSVRTGDDFHKLWHVVYNNDDREDWNFDEDVIGIALYRKMTETEFSTPKNKNKPSTTNNKNKKNRSNENKIKAKLKRAAARNNNDDSVFSHGNYSPAKPYVYEVEYHDQHEKDYEEYIPIPLPEEKRRGMVLNSLCLMESPHPSILSHILPYLIA
jgi:hypothetical protein